MLIPSSSSINFYQQAPLIIMGVFFYLFNYKKPLIEINSPDFTITLFKGYF